MIAVLIGLFLLASGAAYRNGARLAVGVCYLLIIVGFVVIPLYTGLPHLWLVLIALLTMYLLVKGDIAFDEY